MEKKRIGFILFLFLIFAYSGKINAQTVNSAATDNTIYYVSSGNSAAIDVTYTISSAFTGGNTFTAQLSDAAGAWGTPTDIGTRVATDAGTINATIPASTVSGVSYRVRVTGDNPVDIGPQSATFQIVLDNTDPTVSSVTPNHAVVSDDEDGGVNFTLTVVFDEDMQEDGSADPTITFPTGGENPAPTISYSSGAWSNSTTWVASYTVADNNIDMADIDIRVTGAEDLAGNTQNIYNDADNFSVDMLNPTASSVTPLLSPIVDATTGAGTFRLTIAFDEPMNTGVTPTITFPTENPTTTITTHSNNWPDNQTFELNYTVTDNDENIQDVDVRVTVAEDLAGNTLTTYNDADNFSIDMDNATVTSVTPNHTTLDDGNVGGGTFTLTVVYDKTMNTGTDPTISFPTGGEDPVTSTSLSGLSNSWSNATTFVATYDLNDIDEEMLNIDIRVTGAVDVAGNTQVQYDDANNFNIDTENPTVTTVTANHDPITDANTGAGQFTFTIVYDENMNGGTFPSITFPLENPTSTLTLSGQSWSNATTYVATYDVADNAQELANIDISVTGGQDVNINTQVVHNENNKFNIEMGNPAVTSVTPSPVIITDAETGAGNFTITVAYDEAMTTDGSADPTISFPTGGENPAATITQASDGWAGSDYTATYNVTDAGENINDIDVQVTGAEDATGNTQTLYLATDNFDVDMQNPTVSSLTPNLTMVNDGNVGVGTFTLTVVFNEPMDGGTNPTISFPTEIPTATIINLANSWSNATTFVATYDVTDVNENIANIDVRVSVAIDAGGNTQTIYNEANVFSIDTENPAVTSIVASSNPITDDDVGTPGFSLTINYDQNMNAASTPSIVFYNESPVSTLSNPSGSWTNATTYVYDYDVTDANQVLVDIDVRVTGGADVNGNTIDPNPFNDADNFTIEMNNPSVTTVTSSPLTISDSDAGAGNFTLTIDFDEAMTDDGSADPVITFPTGGENPTATITFASDSWTDADTYVATYDVTDVGDNIADIDIHIASATDNDGNLLVASTETDIFSIDMSNPTVSSVTPNVDPITDGNVGASTFTLTVIYSKNMNTGVGFEPTISFPTGGENPEANTLSNLAESWTNATTFVATYGVADANEIIDDIDVRVVGAEDSDGNTQPQYDEPNVFSIDTDDPTVVSITPNINTIVEADAGSNFTVTVVYSKDMNPAFDPNVDFPDESPLSTITYASDTWTNATTHVVTYTIADANQELADIDIRAQSARDLAGNEQPPSTDADDFSIDMIAPNLNPLTIISDNVNNTSLAMSGDEITITFTASETLSAISSATIGGRDATVANTGGLNYTAKLTLDGSEGDGVCDISILYNDAAGNSAGSANADISNGSSVILDYTAPNNQNTVFPSSVSQYGGSTVTIVSSADANNKVWFAPTGQTAETDFAAGATMTEAANGTSTSITAPANDGTYYIYVIDEAGNVSNASTSTLTIDNHPLLANIESGSFRYIEMEGQRQITATITVDDDLDNIVSATIQITGNYQNGEDVLAFTNIPPITGTWTVGTGLMTLSGADTRAAYQAALRSVTYENTSAGPDNSNRTISFTINDGTFDSNIETRGVQMTPTFSVPGDYTDIQTAIDNAVNGDRILVGNGTFTENIDFGGKEIEIIGNGPGNSIIDAAASGSVVVFENGENSNCLLRGFTLQNGAGSLRNLIGQGSFSPNTYYGGGIYCYGASPVFENLIIENNTLSNNDGMGASGAGVYLGNGANAQFDNVTIQNNSSAQYQGGGITIDNSNPVFTTVTINANTTGNYGGGISARNAFLDFTDVTITGNAASGNNGMGGGMFLINCTISFSNVTSNANTASRIGNGICTYSTPNITTGAPNNITDDYKKLH